MTIFFPPFYYRIRNRYEWSKFRSISKLDKKFDDTITDYYKSFIALCKKVCGLKLTEEEGKSAVNFWVDDILSSWRNRIVDFFPLRLENADFPVEMITEEKARRALERINLLSKIREVILPHPLLDERLKLCQISADVPDWWVPGKHDKDLLIGVAK